MRTDHSVPFDIIHQLDHIEIGPPHVGRIIVMKINIPIRHGNFTVSSQVMAGLLLSFFVQTLNTAR